jgi:hypothetical protein
MNDQLPHTTIKSRTSCSATRVGPRAGDQATVPAQQRVGLDQEAGSATSGQHAADRGERRPVGGFQPGAGDPAAQHRELVAQNQDLQVLGSITAGEQDEQLDGPVQREVRECREHRTASEVDGGRTLPGRASMRTGSS